MTFGAPSGARLRSVSGFLPKGRCPSTCLGREEDMKRLPAVVAASFVILGTIWFAPAVAQPNCTRTGDDRANDMRATNGPDVLCALGGDDRVSGRLGDDVLLGEGGRDLLMGGGGGDDLRGGAQGDTLIGGPGRDSLSGGVGSDLLDGTGQGVDLLKGGGGRDVCYADDEDTVRSCERRV
jgi:RTX calcium-binding nonapeptide repeat (4 copies)